MDLVERLLRHDAWTTRQLLLISRELPDEQLDRRFDIGHQSVRATLEHIIYNLEAWIDCILSQKIRASGGNSVEALLTRLDRAAEDWELLGYKISRDQTWDEQWFDATDGQWKTYGGALAHIVTHSMHHRAQLLYMLRLLGVEELPEGDVFSWENEACG